MLSSDFTLPQGRSLTACRAVVILALIAAVGGCQPSRGPATRTGRASSAPTSTVQSKDVDRGAHADSAAADGDASPHSEADQEGESEKPKSSGTSLTPEQVQAAAEKFKETVENVMTAETECRWAATPITIDGRADEPAWQAAQVLDRFGLPWLKEDKRPPRTATEARLLWDRENLYFHAEMEDSDLYADVTEHDGQTWDNDVFELFFKPSDDNPGYYEFQVNAAGTQMDMFLPRRGAGGFGRFKAAHDFHIESQVVRRGTLNDWKDEDDGWSVEGRIPWSDFAPSGGGPTLGDRWTFALCRYDYSVAFEGPDLSTTAPLSRLSFHQYEDYAPLRFVGPSRTSQMRPYGIEKLELCSTSRVVGSPEPPHPYRVERRFPHLKIKQPLAVDAEPGTDDKLLVIQHLGSWRGPGKILRISNDPQTQKIDELLKLDYIAYGLAFHPNYEENGYVFIGMNGPVGSDNKKTRVARYTVRREPPYEIDPASEKLIIEWESDGHNGGDLAFHPASGLLYITAGDGTSDSDTNLTGQDLSNLCATMIRIDVDTPGEQPYSIPPDNPFVGYPGARPEIWAFGFRNPWRMCFDPKNADLWVGQNGQDLWEQVYLVQRGGNYGWSVYEGSHPFYLDRKRGPGPILPPITEHHHSEARSLTGGVVYYGKRLPELYGAYVYGDHSTGKIWAVKHDAGTVTWHQEIADTTLQIGGFGLDQDGELVICDQGGGRATGDALYRLVPTPPEVKQAEFPEKLSETGLFASVADHEPQPPLIPYSVHVPQWSDGARAERYLALTGKPQVRFPGNRGWNFPNGTVAVKTLSLEMEAGKPESRRRIETQLLTRQQGEWQGYSYRWNEEQTDAVLVDKQGQDEILEIRDPDASGGIRKQVWRFASRSECMACHSRAANYVLGLNTVQLNGRHDYGGIEDNQLRTFSHLGLFRFNWLDHEAALYERLRDRITQPMERNAKLLERVLLGEKDADGEETNPSKGKQPEWDFRSAGVLFTPVQLQWARRGFEQIRETWRKEIRSWNRTTTLLPKSPEEYRRLTPPEDTETEVAARARSYLHANCSQCHVLAGGGNAAMELEITADREKLNVFGVEPRHHKYGMDGAVLVAPGDPYRSVLLYRMAKLGGGRMPRVGSNVVDTTGVELIRRWIEQLPAEDSDQEIAARRNRQQSALSRLAEAKNLKAKPAREALDLLLESTDGAMLLLAAIDEGQIEGSLRAAVVEQAAGHASPPVRDLFERFLPLEQRVKRLGNNIDLEKLLALPGDAARGEQLFLAGAVANCKSCHRIGEGADQLGPNLAHVAKKNSKRQILESILDPSKKVEEKYRAWLVLTESGQQYVGLLQKRDDREVVLLDAKNKPVRIPADEIDLMQPSEKSIMPDGLLRDMTAGQAADLLEYLASLK